MVFEEWQRIRRGSWLRLRQVIIGLSERRGELIPEAFWKGVEWVATMRLEGCKHREQYRCFQNAVNTPTPYVDGAIDHAVRRWFAAAIPRVRPRFRSCAIL